MKGTLNKNVAVLAGSLRKESINLKLANALSKVAPTGFEFDFVEIDKIPFFNQDEEHNPTPAVTRLKQQIKDADALMFVTPEYNRSMPGVLKNAIDTASRPHGREHPRVLHGGHADARGVRGERLGVASSGSRGRW